MKAWQEISLDKLITEEILYNFFRLTGKIYSMFMWNVCCVLCIVRVFRYSSLKSDYKLYGQICKIVNNISFKP